MDKKQRQRRQVADTERGLQEPIPRQRQEKQTQTWEKTETWTGTSCRYMDREQRHGQATDKETRNRDRELYK